MTVQVGPTAAMRRRDLLVCAMVAGVSLIVYGLTLAPSLTWSHWGSDGGDLIAAAVTGRVPHPPGFPVYIAVASGFLKLVGGDPATALNGLSAVAAAGTAAIVTAIVMAAGCGGWVASSSALSGAFASWVWSQAVITEVYTMAALLASIAVLLAVLARQKGSVGAWFGAGLAFGLAVSTHLTVALLAPAILLSRGIRWRALLAGWLFGLVPYGLLVFRGVWPQPWGDLRSLGAWIDFVSARLYWGNAFALPLVHWPRRLVAWGALLSRQFTAPGLLLACVGLAQLWRRTRLEAIGLSVTFGLASVYAITYNSADSWVYLVAFLPLLAVALGHGLQWAVGRGVPQAFTIVLPAALLLLNWPNMNLRRSNDARQWLDATLPKVPAQAVVVTREDEHTFALWYATEALGLRDDLLVVDQRLLPYPFYQAYLTEVRGVAAGEPEKLVIQGRTLCEIDVQGELLCR